MREDETPLLNRHEQVLYGRLVRAFPGHIILAQAELSRLGLERSVAEFVILRADFTALATVQLRERAMPRDGQNEQERRLEMALQAAGIRVLRVCGLWWRRCRYRRAS
jgi:hypothetical protein